MTDIGNTTSEKLRAAVITAMVRMASQGSVPAASQVLTVLAEVEAADASRIHKERLDELANDSINLAFYLGELGVSIDELAHRFDREPTEGETEAWGRGNRERGMEIRAIELETIRQYKKIKIPKWMHDGND